MAEDKGLQGSTNESEIDDKPEWIPEWLVQHGQPILLGVAIAAVAFAGFRLYETSQDARIEQSWGDLSRASSPETKIAAAATVQIPAAKALAFLDAGDLFLQQAVFPVAATEDPTDPADAADALGDTDSEVTDELATEPATESLSDPAADRAESLQQARSSYQQALDVAGISALIRVNAMLGLAAVDENEMLWADAKAKYEQIQQDFTDHAELSSPALEALVETRLNLIDGMATGVVIAPPATPGVLEDASLMPVVPLMDQATDSPRAPIAPVAPTEDEAASTDSSADAVGDAAETAVDAVEDAVNEVVEEAATVVDDAVDAVVDTEDGADADEPASEVSP